MRRMALMTAVFALMISVGFTSAAGAATTEGHVKVGSVWTFQDGSICYVETIAKGHTWTADNGDSGTYTGAGKKITETWTGGKDAGLTFRGKYIKGENEYFGTEGPDGVNALLSEIALRGC